MNTNFTTREMSLSAYLIGKGMKFLGAEHLHGESYRFVFEDVDKCQELEREFESNKQIIFDSMGKSEQSQKLTFK